MAIGGATGKGKAEGKRPAPVVTAKAEVKDADGNDTIAIKTMAYFGISYDHRLVDGAVADQFMSRVKKTDRKSVV